MRSSIAVANHLLKLALTSKATLSGDQLQCLTYFAHGLRLALVNDALLDEVVMARRDGVFIEGLTKAGAVGSHSLTGLLTLIQARPDGMLDEVIPALDTDDPACATLDMVWSRFGSFSGYELGLFARGAGSPWDETWNDPERLAAILAISVTLTWREQETGESAFVIPNSMIRRWFRSLVIQEQKDQSSADGLEQTVHAARLRLEHTIRISTEKKLRSA